MPQNKVIRLGFTVGFIVAWGPDSTVGSNVWNPSSLPLKANLKLNKRNK